MKETIERLARREARQLGRYNAGLSDDAVRQRFALTDIARLASNENPLGMSPLAEAALRTEVTRNACYPDPASLQLRAVIAARTGVTPDQVVMGNGSENLLEMLCLAFLNPGDRVVTLVPSFGLHHLYPKMLGAEVTLVSVNAQMEYDLDAWAQALVQPAKMVVFSNPSNPVGCMLGREGFERLIAMTPPDCVLVIDEAYYEYCAAHPDYPDSLSLLRQQTRPWIVLRTFSKAYGLAGLRVGYGLACDAEMVELLDRVRTPFNINRMAQAAAQAALLDVAHVARSVTHVTQQRAWLREQLHAMGWFVAPSQANFLFVNVAQDSAALAERLLHFGVIVKPWLEAGYTQWIRISVGSEVANQQCITALRQCAQ